MAIKITVDTVSELLWIKTVVDQGVLNCERPMKFLNKEYGLPLVPRSVDFIHSSDYAVDLPKVAELMRKEKSDE